MKDLTGKCPVMHGAATTGITGTTNSDWWPNQLNLNILRQHDRKSNPFGDDLLYPTIYLAQIMWRQIDETVVKAREAMEWLKQVTRLAAIEDLPITWSTPSGFQVIQAYREVTTRRIETKMNEGIGIGKYLVFVFVFIVTFVFTVIFAFVFLFVVIFAFLFALFFVVYDI